MGEQKGTQAEETARAKALRLKALSHAYSSEEGQQGWGGDRVGMKVTEVCKGKGLGWGRGGGLVIILFPEQ